MVESNFIQCVKRYSGDQIKKNEMVWHVARMWMRRRAYRVLMGKPEERRPLKDLGVIMMTIVK